jgi:hypothetical protein
VVPDKFKLTFDIRITPTTNIEQFEAQLRYPASELCHVMYPYLLFISVADTEYPGSEFFHAGSWIQGQKDYGSRIQIHIKEFKYF